MQQTVVVIQTALSDVSSAPPVVQCAVCTCLLISLSTPCNNAIILQRETCCAAVQAVTFPNFIGHASPNDNPNSALHVFLATPPQPAAPVCGTAPRARGWLQQKMRHAQTLCMHSSHSLASTPSTATWYNPTGNKSCLREQRMKEQERAMVLLQQQIASSPSPRSQRDKL